MAQSQLQALATALIDVVWAPPVVTGALAILQDVTGNEVKTSPGTHQLSD